MKNFYYEKCRKSIYHKDWPINRPKTGTCYYYKTPNRWYNSNGHVMRKRIPQVITACKTEFVLDVTHPHNTTYGGEKPNKTIQCIPNASLAQMDALVDTYNKRNPSYHFDYDPTQTYITFYGRNHNCLNRFRFKEIIYPCQKIGSSFYTQFRRFKFAIIDVKKTHSLFKEEHYDHTQSPRRYPLPNGTF